MHGIWRGVRQRVEDLAAQPGAAAVFGVSGHLFTLDAPLTQEQLTDWETRVGATLPALYRSFLTEVAAAGASPHYGLLGFRVIDGIAHWVGDIWLDDRASDGPISPHIDETGRVTFDRWYLTWLERAEATCA